MFKRGVPIAILSLTGTLLVAAHFSPMTQSWGEVVLNWFSVVAAITAILGAGNLLLVNLEKISSRRPGWAYSAITIAAFAAMLVFGFLKIGAVPNPQNPTVYFAGDYETRESAYGWMYEYVMSPLTATMFALLAFYVASAAFRAFRAKNIEANILLVTAFIILLARTYAAELLTGWVPKDSAFFFVRLDAMSTGVIEHVATAGMRAITIGIALGALATSLRFMLGIDKSYLPRS